MTQAAPAQPPATPKRPVKATKMPEVVIDEKRFEGKEVVATAITCQGTAKLSPEAHDPDHRVLTVDDVLTVEMDMKCVSIGYDVDKNGQLVRVQRVKPIEGSVRVVDVIRARETRIR